MEQIVDCFAVTLFGDQFGTEGMSELRVLLDCVCRSSNLCRLHDRLTFIKTHVNTRCIECVGAQLEAKSDLPQDEG